MIRICIFQPFGERRGGSDNLLLTLLRHLDRGRFEATVAFFGDGGFVEDVRALGFEAHTFPSGRLRDPRHVVASARRARRLLERERPNLVVNWLSTAHVYAGIGAWRAGLSDRCVWFQQDLFGGRSPERARLGDRAAASRGRMLDRVATAIPAAAIGCCSEAVRRAQDEIHPRRPTFTVLPGIDQPRQLESRDQAAVRDRLAIPADAVVVGTVGRLFAWKGHHQLVLALAELAASESRMHGLIVGGGGHRADARYEAYLNGLVRDHGLEGRVTFTGQVPDATPYLQAMDVFVSASAPEPFGLVLVEALALGVPAVAVARGGPIEIIENGESGLLTPSDAPSELAAAISRLAGDRELRLRLSERGRERYRRRFQGDRMARDMERRFEELAR